MELELSILHTYVHTPACCPHIGTGYIFGQVCLPRHNDPFLANGNARPPEQLHVDWMFAGSSRATDAMGDAVRLFHTYSVELFDRAGCAPKNHTCWVDGERSGQNPTMATHSIWPMHAVKQRLQIRFGKLADGTWITLSRGSEAHNPQSLQCYRNLTKEMPAAAAAAAPPMRILPAVERYEAPFMREQCPYHLAARCKVVEYRKSACLPAPPEMPWPVAQKRVNKSLILP